MTDVRNSGLMDVPRIMMLLEHESPRRGFRKWIRKKSIQAKIEMARRSNEA